jgi:hypothetical protein
VCGATCCAGTGCCGTVGTCQTSHPNGLGGAYFDCGALDEHTAAQARLAAESWSAAGQTVESGLPCSACLCRQTATQAAVWCYVGSNARGRVEVTNSPNCFAAACPFVGSPAWR